MIERKNLSPCETILFFPTPFSLNGTFYIDKDISETFPPIQNIFDTQLAKCILWTADFIYIESITDTSLEDLEAVTIAEAEEWRDAKTTMEIPHQIAFEQKIKILLKSIIAPFLQKDGGDIEFISYQNNHVYVRFLGKCHGCPYATKTLKEKVEKNLIRYIPEIREVSLV